MRELEMAKRRFFDNGSRSGPTTRLGRGPLGSFGEPSFGKLTPDDDSRRRNSLSPSFSPSPSPSLFAHEFSFNFEEELSSSSDHLHTPPRPSPRSSPSSFSIDTELFLPPSDTPSPSQTPSSSSSSSPSSSSPKTSRSWWGWVGRLVESLPFLSKPPPTSRVVPLTGKPSARIDDESEEGRGGVRKGGRKGWGWVGGEKRYPTNAVTNQKYNVVTFLPLALYEEFRFFFNLYFLVVALSQLIPVLQIGFMIAYMGPLVFVVAISLAKEAYDDYKRFLRDREVNGQTYMRLKANGEQVPIASADICVGHVIIVSTNQRVPADLLLIRTSEEEGASYIRTDQLDGETDWKLRRSVAATQELPQDKDIFQIGASIYAEKPKKDIYDFVGTFSSTCSSPSSSKEGLNEVVVGEGRGRTEPLTVDNMLWGETVVASGTCIGVVVYTGPETRAVMNTNKPRSKQGLLDHEVNQLSKILFGLMVLLSLVMTALKGFHGIWPIYFFRFVLLFSAIIPISLRVNLDLAKSFSSYLITNDRNIPSTVVRTSTIPEELGRVHYLLSDKTGTLTQNEMVFKRLCVGFTTADRNIITVVQNHLKKAIGLSPSSSSSSRNRSFSPTYSRRGKVGTRDIRERKEEETTSQAVYDAILAMAVCHNVTPAEVMTPEGVPQRQYKASSPDEIALVKFTESVGMTLCHRTLNTISVERLDGVVLEFEILFLFPFTSELRRMSVVVRERETGKVWFYCKGADGSVGPMLQYNDWVDEEAGNMARVGLRTLVFGMRELTEEELAAFGQSYKEAQLAVDNRELRMREVMSSLEYNLTPVALTGVEDCLQDQVCETLEMLRNAGIRVFMLTGDKIETATCIARSAKLVRPTDTIYQMTARTADEAWRQLNYYAHQVECVLIIDGGALQICFDHFQQDFIEVVCKAPAVVCCRCSPTQKSYMTNLIKNATKSRVCAIGDGGNDVGMIQEADVGIGIVGKEGQQASLAADFSVTQFGALTRLLLWHGRNSYQRSAKLSQFIIHRGLIISFIQAVFSAIFYYAAIAIYSGWLIVGYSTVFTMAPVFSLVLDTDVTERVTFLFPELYQELQKGRALSNKTFFLWVMKSVYQSGVIMVMSILLFEENYVHIVSITFTSLICTELANVGIIVHTWHKWMVLSIIITLCVYISSMVFLDTYFDIAFLASSEFLVKVLLTTFLSTSPLLAAKIVYEKLNPPIYAKLREEEDDRQQAKAPLWGE